MEKFQEPPIEQKPVARWTVWPPLDSASNPRTVAAKKAWHGDSSSTRRCSGALHTPPVGQQRHRHEFGHGGPSLPSRRPRRFIWAATEDRPTRTRRTGTESDARGNGMPCQPWFAVAAGEYREQSRPAGQGRAGQCPVHAFGRSVVVRLHTCIATSCFFFFLSLLLHFCPLLLLCFFSLFFIQVTFLFFPPPPCRVKLDVGSCTYVDGILFQQVC